MVGMRCQDVFSGTGGHGGRRSDLCAERLHDAAAVRLLLVADFHLIYCGFQPEQSCGVCQGCTPLSGTGFGRDVGYALLLAVVCLRDGRVQFVRPHRADTLVLEVDVRRSAECFLQSVGAYQRCAAVVLVHFAHFLGYLDPGVRLVQLLPAQLFGEDREHVFRFQRLLGGGVQRWHGFVHHICLYVVPVVRNFLFREDESFSLVAHSDCLILEFRRQM